MSDQNVMPNMYRPTEYSTPSMMCELRVLTLRGRDPCRVDDGLGGCRSNSRRRLEELSLSRTILRLPLLGLERASGRA